MQKLWNKWIIYINENIGRKLTCMMVPIMCIVVSVTILLVSFIYTRRLIANIERSTQYVTETFKLNMDFCTADVKNTLNVLSLDEDVRYLVTMNLEAMDYGRFLESQREVKDRLGAEIALKNYVQDIIIIGNNGYQYNYRTALEGDIKEKEWFVESVDKYKKGFQYILPHTVDYYKLNSAPSNNTLSIILSIYDENSCVGYVMCDLSMNSLMTLPLSSDFYRSMKAYLINMERQEYYDFQSQKIDNREDLPFMKYIENKDKDFLTIDQNFIVYSKMENSEWCIAVIYLYNEIISPAITAQKIGVVMLIISCLLIIALSQGISKSFRRPIDELLARIHQVENENFKPVDVNLEVNQPGEIIQIRKSFENMTKRINDLVHRVYLDEIYQKNMEYESLVNQVNPHFIYNVLQLIQAKAVLCENFEIDEIVVDLSRLMRYTMENKEKIVKIEDECCYIESYLNLYEKRYNNKFSYDIYIDKNLKSYPVLKFIMQPIVENCIKHGFKGLKRTGYICIRIYAEDQRVYFLTEDNGRGIPRTKLEQLMEYMKDMSDQELDCIGLKNTFQRLKLTYGDDAGIDICSVENEGTTVYCYIPFSQEVHNVQDYVC